MADITEIAVAAWRLEKWLDNVNVERKMAAKSALRSIKRYLQENEIEVVDLTGTLFDVGLAVSVVNNESSETDEDKLIIREMVKPIVKEKGAVIQYGQVILGDEVKQSKENKSLESDSAESSVTEAVSIAADLERQPGQVTTEPVEESHADIVSEPFTAGRAFNKGMLAWLSIVALQVVGIVLLMQTNRNANVNTLNSALQEPGIISESGTLNPNESEVLSMVSVQGDRINIIDSRINEIDSTLQNISGSMSEVLDHLKSIDESGKSDNQSGTESSEKDYILYTVVEGDNLIAICSKHNIDYYTHKNEIMEINNITDPSIIMIGQELKLPAQ